MKWVLRIGIGLIALLLLAAGAGLLVLRTSWFKEQLRRRVVAELENATGGRVEVSRVRFNARRWQGRLEGLTIHGREGPLEKPLLHAGALELDLKVVSFLRRQVDLAGLRLEAVEIHVRVAPDGSTNLPEPPNRSAGRLFTEDLLNLAVGRFELKQGALWWNDQRYSLETAMSELRAQVRFEKPGRYAGRLEAGHTLLSSPFRVPSLEHLAAGFVLMRDRIELSELVVRTAQSEGKAGGVITDLSRPRVQLHYETAVDAREAAVLVARPELKTGRFELRGSFESAGGKWSTGGKLVARQLAAAGTGFHLKDVSLAGNYHADIRELRVENLVMRLLGGEWKGRLTGSRSRISLKGGLEGIRLEAAAEAFYTPDYPLAQLGWTAVISGPLDAEGLWPNLSVEANLTLVFPENPGTLTPIEGVCRASYQGGAGEIQLQEARLSTAATQVAASGRVVPSRERPGAVRQDLRFWAQTTRLEELTRTAAVFGRKIEVPARLEGRAILQGRLSGTLEAPEVDATLDVARFVHENRPWDSLTGRVQWSPRRLRLIAGRLTRGNTAIRADLTAALENGEFTDRSPLDAVVSVRDTQVEDLAALAGEKLPVSGLMTATLKLQGTRQDPRGAGRVEIRRGAGWGESFDSLRTALLVERGEIRWNSLQVSKANAVVVGSGMIHPERRTFRWDARADNLPLSAVGWVGKSGKKVTGTASFELAGSGRLRPGNWEVAEFAVEGDLRLRKVAVNGTSMGDLSAAIRPTGDKLALQIESNFAGGQARGTGEMKPQAPFPLQGKIEFRNLDLAAVARIAGAADSPARVSADGTMAVEGEAKRPESLTGNAELTRLEIGWPEGRGMGKAGTLHNAEPVKWRLANEKITLDALHMVGEGTDLHGSGSAGFGPAGALNLAVRGSLSLAALGGMRPAWKVGGAATIQAAVTGTVQQPDIRGTLEIRNGSAGAEDLPLSLGNANGLITFAGRRATVQKLTLEAGGGEISISGDAEFAGGPVTYRLRADGQHVRLRHPRGATAVLDGTLTFTGTNQRSMLSGEMRITRAGTRGSADIAGLLASLKQPARTPSSNDWLQGALLNVSVVTAPDARYDIAQARNVQADANLRLQGNALNPALLGRINLTQGEFQFQGTRYSINRGEITFQNPFRIDPILNLDLETRVSGYDITLTLAGPLQKLNVSHRSDPPLPFNEVITLLAVGRAPTTDPTLAAQQTAQARSLTQLGATGVISQALAKPAGSSRLQRFFGVSRLKLDPELAGPEGNPNARVTLEQQVGRDITFTYVYNLASAQEQIIRVQWAIDKQLSLIAVRDQNGVFGVDFLYKKRFR